MFLKQCVHIQACNSCNLSVLQVIDSAAKVAFILSMESHLEEVTRQLVRLKELSPSLESEQLRNIPLLLRQLAKLTTTMVEQREKYELVDDGIQDLVSR